MPQPDERFYPTAPLVRRLRHDLLAWYDVHQRDLPWRRQPVNPYHVLVSETMLQQTQVATVIPYFHRFIEAFPTIQSLAQADEAKVLQLWQGLGYYSRARRLREAAQRIVQDHGGDVPAEIAALRRLPGVGDYTAGAIASIAFGQREPAVDGNVVRVLTRWRAIDQPTDQPAVKRALRELARELVPPDRPGDFNQALMELGATVCSPRSPRCLTCPAAKWCEANRQGEPEAFPALPARKPPREVDHHVLALHRRGRLLFRQRPAVGLWASLWELPTAESPDWPDPAIGLSLWAREAMGVAPERAPEQVGGFTHVTTHRLIRFTLWKATATGRLRPDVGRWLTATQALAELPMANPQRRAIALINDA